MKFGSIPIEEAEGGIAVHSIRKGSLVLKKGTRIGKGEIAALHRAHHSAPGACVRATWLRTRPELFKRGVDFYRWAVLPAVEEFEGFCSASLLVDPTSARAVVSVTYDSREAMEHCTESARSLRTSMMRDLGLDQEDVGEFELVLAHLRVPELV